MAAGLGKTATVLAAAYMIDAFPLLIITKAIGRHVWPRDARWMLGTDREPGILWRLEPHPPGRESAGWYSSLDVAMRERVAMVTGYEILGNRIDDLMRFSWHGLVLDEAHELKGGYQRPPVKRDGTKHYFRYHHAKKLASSVRAWGGPVWSVTATPIKNRRRDLYAQLDVVAPGVFGTSWDFLHRYCDGHINQWGGLDSNGETETPELLRRLTGMFVCTRREDVADQLPSVQRVINVVQPEGIDLRSMGGGVERALDRAASLKSREAVDLAGDYLAGGGKVVVTTTRRRLAHQLALMFSGDKRTLPRAVRENLATLCVTGEMPANERVRVIGEFNARPTGPAVLVATADSLRESVDLHQTDALIVCALPYTPGDLVQLEGRLGRLGGRPCTIHYLVAERTIDDAIRAMLLDKLSDTGELKADTILASSMADVLRGDDGKPAYLRDWMLALESGT
jgi:hypothetical protein